MICDICGSKEAVVGCPQCEISLCVECRRSRQCPQCNSLMEENAKCSLSGGCGDGRQEDPT